MDHTDYTKYATSDWPQTFGELLDWSLARIDDPENKPYFRLIDHAGPARALTVTYLVPVFAVAYGVLALGESVTLWMLLCGAVILTGTALASGLVRLPRRAQATSRS